MSSQLFDLGSEKSLGGGTLAKFDPPCRSEFSEAPCVVAAFVLNSELYTEERPLVCLCVGLIK